MGDSTPMRITVTLDDALVAFVMERTGAETKTEMVRRAVNELRERCGRESVLELLAKVAKLPINPE